MCAHTPSTHSHTRTAIRRSAWNSALLLALALAIVLCRPCSAQLDAEPDTSYLAGTTETESLGLSLEQAHALAIASSPVTRSAAAAVRVARGERMREAGVFDPVLFGERSRLSTDSPVSSPFSASEVRQTVVSAGASWLSPLGTSITAALTQNTIESNAPFTTLPRERRARARIDFVQPLWRGFGAAAARGELRASDRELIAARSRLEAASVDLRAAVDNAYWDLFAAGRDLRVQRLQRQRAAIFLRDQILRGRAGATGPGPIAAARTFLAEQETRLFDARLRAHSASDGLRNVLGQSSVGEARLHCTDEPPLPGAVEPADEVLRRALARNPALRALEADAEAAGARLRRALRNAWPTIEAFGGYGGSGLAGTGRQIVFGADTVGADTDTGYDEAWDQVRDDAYPDWALGLRVRVPLGWRAERGERLRHQGLEERAREAARAGRLALENAVRRAHREAELAREALGSVRALVEATREQARIGRLEYRAGRTTAYDLVGIEADLARAELLETQILVRIARSQTELRRLADPTAETPR